jgi:hypothetical protein
LNVSQDQQPSVGVNWLRRHKDVLGLVGLSLLGGAGLFILLYGTIPVVFSNLDWVYASQDSLQHFLGWQFFRNAPWTFPLGAIPAYGTPYGVTLTYTDSIPLLAIGLKLFNGLLKQRFQYLGLWTLMCFILQFLFGGLILREFTPRILPQVLGAALLVLAPPLLFRTFYHTSLVSQWLVLLAIYLLLLGRRKPVGVWPWALTAVLAVTIHPYFLPMVLPLFVVALVERFQRERQLRPLLWQLLVVLGITALAGYAIGVFALGSDNLASSGFGTYSTNLNALFNSFGTSQFVRALPVFHYHQDEGYSYLGLGLLGVVGLALISLGVQRAFRNGVWQNRYLLGLCAGWTLFSLSTTITWNEHVLLSLALPDALGKLSGMFRASGRFFWPVFYLLVIFALVRLIQKVRFAPLILACALAVQLLDLQPLIQGKRFEATQDYTSPLTAAFWDSAANTFKHVMILPAFRQTNAYAPFAIFAATHGQTLNWGYFARANYAAIQAYGQQETQNLIGGKASADTLYVFCQISDVRQIAASPQNQLAFYNIDSYFLGYPQSHPLAQPATPWAQERVSMEQIEGLSLKSFLQTVKPSEIVFLTGRGMPFEGLDADTRAQLRAAGLKNEFAPDSQDSYIAGWGQPLGGAVLEQASGDKLDQVYAKYQQVGDLAMPFDLNLRSAGQQAGNYASVQMNLKEYSHNKSGLNVLIYNTLNGWVKSLSFTHGYRVVCP